MAAPRPNWVVMPRIWNCAPPKFDFVNVTLGTWNWRSRKLLTCFALRSVPVNAVTATGTVWMSSALRSVVTITVSICAKAGAVKAVVTSSAAINWAEWFLMDTRMYSPAVRINCDASSLIAEGGPRDIVLSKFFHRAMNYVRRVWPRGHVWRRSCCTAMRLSRAAMLQCTRLFVRNSRRLARQTLWVRNVSCKLDGNDNNSNRSFWGARLCRELPQLRGVESVSAGRVKAVALSVVPCWTTSLRSVRNEA